MALTKAQVSLVTVATLGITPGGYLAQLQAFNTQKEAAAFIATTGLLNEGTNAEFVNTVIKNLGVSAESEQKAAFYKALEGGVSRADAAVDFANAQLVEHGSIAQVNKAIASTSTSMDLGALKAELSDALRVKFSDKNTDQQDAILLPDGSQTINNIGKAQLDAGQSKISVDYTFELKNQIGENATYTGKFLSPILDEVPEDTSGSKVVLELRNLREDENSVTPLKDLPTNGFGFEIDGELIMVQSDAIDDAETYAALKAAIESRVAELGRGENLPDGADAALYAKLATFNVEFGKTKFAEERDANGNITKTHDVKVTEIILTDEAGATLNPRGYTNRDGIIDSSGFTLFAQMADESGTSIQYKIATNLEADNVGYGSQGATVNLVGQSNSDKGIQELNVTANNNVWFTKLESQKNAASINHLEIINLVTGSEGYFRVGTQKNDPTHLVALVDEDFDNAGLVDVQQLNAVNAGSVAVNSYITDAVINRFDLKDTGLYTTDDTDALIQYNLTSNSDVLQLKIDSEVVAYADTKVNISTGGGDDFVHLQIDQGNSYGTTWLTNQQLNDNIKIEAASGNNTIWTEGDGNATITTGSGSDRILVDNSGKQTVNDLNSIAKLADLGYGNKMNALFAVNAASANLGDIVSNTNNGLDNNTANVVQVYETFKNTVSVKFKGFETTHVTIESTNYTTSTQQVNQAIKKAILEDATLSKLLTVKEFPGNVLVVESLIDGEMVLGDLSFDFVNPAANGAATLAKGQLELGANELTEAAKAYAAPGTATPAAVTVANLASNFTGLNTIYNTQKAFVVDGAGTPGTPAVAEVQTLTMTAGALAATDTIAVTLGTDAVSSTTVVTFTAGAALATPTAIATAMLADGTFTAAVTAAGWTVAAGGAAGELEFTHNAGGVDINTNVTAASTDVAGDPSYTALVSTGAEDTAGAAATTGTGVDIQGIDSTAHSDNVVNAGAGNDVIVLGTGQFSNDTVVLEGNFGKTTIVNFDDTAAADTAGNGGDLLDFTAYLNSNYGADGQADVTLTNTLTTAGNTVTVVDFSSLTGNTDGLVLADDELTASINTTKLAVELNADFTAGTTAATNHVFLIHKNTGTVNANEGEYVVVTATSTAASSDLTGVKVVGTLDFGEAQTFVQGNFVDFA